MSSHFTRILVSSLLIGGAAANHDRVEDFIFDLIAEAQTTVVLFEMGGMARSLYFDATSGTDLPDSGELGDYLRTTQMRRARMARDPAIDPWGSPYELHRGEGWFELVSTGPDRIQGTEDDLVVGREW